MDYTAGYGIRCIECGKDAVYVIKQSGSICDLIEAKCNACGADIGDIIESVEKEAQHGSDSFRTSQER